jgi:hypothetical protein
MCDRPRPIQARMFDPPAGIAEDPATGSATAILSGQLLATGALADGTSWSLRQGVEMGRPSDLRLTVDRRGEGRDHRDPRGGAGGEGRGRGRSGSRRGGLSARRPLRRAGLYEMSRRLQRNESFGWSDILTVMADQRKREMGWMAFVTLFILWVWFYQIRLWLAIILQDASFSDFDGFLDAVFFTAEGWTFLAIGTLVGAGLSAVLFAVTVVAMPLLLDRETDFVTAMLTSLRSVAANPVVMLTWAAIISVTMLLSLVPAFLGLIFTLPILGHTTWHLYQRVVPPTEG